jgi:protein Cut8
MDGRSPLAFLQQSPRFNTFPRLVKPNSSPRSSPAPSAAHSPRANPPQSAKLSVSAKRKAPFADENEDEDSMMTTSPQLAHRTLKRPRQSSATPGKRPLPLSRLLDSIDKPALINLLSAFLSRHPELASEIQSLAPKVTPQTAIAAITKLEDAFQASFPYGGDKANEYAYSRVHAPCTALLSAISEYTNYFLPPTSISPAELLSFLDSVTHVLHRIPLFHNPIHNIARETAFADISNAWETAIRYFLESNGSYSFVLGGWMQRLETHAQKAEILRRIVEDIRQQVSWNGN